MKLKKINFIIFIFIFQFLFNSCGNTSQLNLNINLISPINGVLTKQENVEFIWNIENNINNLYSNIFIGKSKDELENIDTIQNNFYLISSLDYETIYYWKIQVSENGKLLKETKIQSFTTVQEPKPTYLELKNSLTTILNNIETEEIVTLEQSLSNMNTEINNPENNITYYERNDLKGFYNQIYGWLTIRKYDKSLSPAQINYFMTQIGYGYNNNESYSGLVFQILNDLSVDIKDYSNLLYDQSNYLNTSYKSKSFNNVIYSFENYITNLQILYSIIENKNGLIKLENYFTNDGIYDIIYDFAYGNYPE